jgi:hypothetical protein
MAELKKIKNSIAELASRRHNVTLQEIEWILKQLKQHGYFVTERPTAHGRLFRVESQRFHVCCHNPGSKQVKACYVDEFVDAMLELGLFED